MEFQGNTRRETFTTPTPPRLVVRVAAGQVELETTETGETTVELGPLNERSRDAVERAEVACHGDEIRVEVDQKRLLLGRTPEIRVVVRAPHSARARVTTASADVSGRGRYRDVEVKTASGDVDFDDVVGELDVNAVSGDVRVRTVGGEASVRSVSGDVSIGRAGRGGSFQSVSGDVALGELVEGEVAVKTVSGDVHAGIARGSGIWIDAKSVSGKTTSELDVGDDLPAEGGPMIRFRANSVSGDIRIARATAVAA
jgi:DUF4097 and DUF4098 domain-containing protein YvlB